MLYAGKNVHLYIIIMCFYGVFMSFFTVFSSIAINKEWWTSRNKGL